MSWFGFRISWQQPDQKSFITKAISMTSKMAGESETSAARVSDGLDDLDSILSQPAPSLGTPAGVTIPIFMASDDSIAITTSCYDDDDDGCLFGITRTISIDVVSELYVILAERAPLNVAYYPTMRDVGSYSPNGED
jgi:hypothetical protein